MKRLTIVLAVLTMVPSMSLAYAAADEDTMQGQGNVSNVAPTCQITQPADGSSHIAGTSISFAATAQDNNNDNLTYWWNFGDGSDNVYGASATHSYSTAGTYTVTLTVSDGELSASDNISITVTSPPSLDAGPPSLGAGPSPPPSDTTPPTLTVLFPTTTWVGPHLTARVSASDASGIDWSSIVVKLDGSPVEFTFSNGVIVIVLSDVEPGAHSLWVGVADLEGNSGERTISFTVVPEVATVQLGAVVAGENAVADFSASGTPVRKVALLPSQSLENIVVNVRVIDEKPPELPVLPGEVFTYLEFTTDVPLQNATIDFAVPREWMERNGVDGGTIRLYRYSSSWRGLPTVCIEENATHRFYRATTSGFSIFAIAGQPPAVTQPSTDQPDLILLTLLALLVAVVCMGVVSLCRPSKEPKLPKVSKKSPKPQVEPLKPLRKPVGVQPEAKSKIGTRYIKHMMPTAKKLVATGKSKSGRSAQGSPRGRAGKKRSKG